MTNLIQLAKDLIKEGIYNQDVLFALMFPTSNAHYAVVREAIHKAKVN